MIKKWYGLARILPKCYLKLLHPFVCYSLSKDRCSAWKLPICCFDSIIAFDYRNCSHIPIYPSYINSLTLAVLDFDVHLHLKYRIFSKQNFSLQCSGTTTCVVAKPLVCFKQAMFVTHVKFYNKKLIWEYFIFQMQMNVKINYR